MEIENVFSGYSMADAMGAYAQHYTRRRYSFYIHRNWNECGVLRSTSLGGTVGASFTSQQKDSDN